MKTHQRPYTVQEFTTTVPIQKKAILKADGENIPCRSVGLQSGKITSKATICSSTSEIPSFDKISTPIITFNPYCEAISYNTVFINAPAVAIRPKDVGKVIAAEKIEGYTKIAPTTYIAKNILVGNTTSPQVICFAHYDCRWSGAWDNGGGVTALMGTLLCFPHLLENALFVFWANEEISYDTSPAYRCKGARAFEKKYFHLLEKSKEIVVIDGIGRSSARRINHDEQLTFIFWIKNLKQIQHKIRTLANRTLSDITFYHSELDTLENIKEEHLVKTMQMIRKKMEALIE
ncbi:MAG: M28 family peptidase [Candidatus Peribacteria bacterium]|nr:M28 family peptidase [Candidatus Peribacteria bacterium]